jgi:hypothetical protein
LDEWRKSTGRGVALPERLWASAGRLAQRHGIYTTARALGLEYNKLKRASGGVVTKTVGRAKTSAVPKAIKFVELIGALPVASSGARLSLQNPDGQKLHMEMAPGAAAEVVLQLCRSGWGSP